MTFWGWSVLFCVCVSMCVCTDIHRQASCTPSSTHTKITIYDTLQNSVAWACHNCSQTGTKHHWDISKPFLINHTPDIELSDHIPLLFSSDFYLAGCTSTHAEYHRIPCLFYHHNCLLINTYWMGFPLMPVTFCPFLSDSMACPLPHYQNDPSALPPKKRVFPKCCCCSLSLSNLKTYSTV